MLRFKWISLLAVLFIAMVVQNSTVAQNDPCDLPTVLSSFQAAALSAEVEAWAQRYAESDCSASTKRGVNALVQAFNLIAAGASETGSAPVDVSSSGSTFDNDTQGWAFFGDATPLKWNADGGNPGGHICSSDRGEGVWWYYEAPSSFVESFISAYGLVLHFDLKQVRTDEQGDPADQFEDIFLTGAGLTLVYNTNYNPSTGWTHYAVPLTESSGWLTPAGRPPSRDQMLNVLENATVLRIRCEYRAGEDSSCLDNVELRAD